MTFISVDMQPCALKGILYRQKTTINIILVYIRKNKILIMQDISPNSDLQFLKGQRKWSSDLRPVR